MPVPVACAGEVLSRVRGCHIAAAEHAPTTRSDKRLAIKPHVWVNRRMLAALNLMYVRSASLSARAACGGWGSGFWRCWEATEVEWAYHWRRIA